MTKQEHIDYWLESAEWMRIPNKIKKVVEQYLTLLKNNNVPLKDVYLFGSYSNGSYNNDSDIDIAIVSEIFEGNRILDKDKIRKYSVAISSDLEILPFPPDDFNESNPLAKEIIKTGIRLV